MLVILMAGRGYGEGMRSVRQVRPESERVTFLLRRDGHEKTRDWVERTVSLYREALAQPRHYASDPGYRPLFETAVREFEEWLAAGASSGGCA